MDDRGRVVTGGNTFTGAVGADVVAAIGEDVGVSRSISSVG